MRNFAAFVTIAGLLATALLAWAQFWGQADKSDPNRYFSLVWLYVAVALDLLAVALAGYGHLRLPHRPVPALPVGLLAASLEMSLLLVCQSFLSNALTLKLLILPSLDGPSGSDPLLGPVYSPRPVTEIFVRDAFAYTTMMIGTTIIGAYVMLRRLHDVPRFLPWLANTVVVYGFYVEVVDIMVKVPSSALEMKWILGILVILFWVVGLTGTRRRSWW